MTLLKLYLSVFLTVIVVGLPVTKKEQPPAEEHDKKAQLPFAVGYERYLKEVFETLDADEQFRQKLDTAAFDDIKSGKIAQELSYVNHGVRTKLDEIKRAEVERLRSLATQQYKLSNDIDQNHMKKPEHVDITGHTFEIKDLQKLIRKTSKDMEEADRQRREEFKQYELQKEYEKQQKLNEAGDNRKKIEEEIRQNKEKHNKHEKVHHPVNKAQLEEVWENQDHMEGQEFDPQTFFMIHDVDGNGYWDENELKALFVKELDKVYKEGVPEDDLRERAEEMERMREHVFKESDTNHDGLISYQEFIEQTKRDEFQTDPGWDTVDNMPQYTHEEYLQYEKHMRELQQQNGINHNMPPQHQFQGNNIDSNINHNMPHHQPPPQYQGSNLNQNNVHSAHNPQYQQPPQYQAANVNPNNNINSVPSPQYQQQNQYHGSNVDGNRIDVNQVHNNPQQQPPQQYHGSNNANSHPQTNQQHPAAAANNQPNHISPQQSQDNIHTGNQIKAN